jgi:hypothetical protein
MTLGINWSVIHLNVYRVIHRIVPSHNKVPNAIGQGAKGIGGKVVNRVARTNTERQL